MHRIINAEASVQSKKDLEDAFKTQTKFKHFMSKNSSTPFDIDKMKETQKKVYNHVESKTSLFFLPQIKTPHIRDKLAKRSHSTNKYHESDNSSNLQININNSELRDLSVIEKVKVQENQEVVIEEKDYIEE